MATSAGAKQSSKSKSAAKSDTSLKAPSKELLLTAAHVIKIQAERFLSPLDVPKGVYTLEQKCGHLFTSKSPENFGKFTYQMVLEGFGLGDGGKKNPERRSFLVALTMEAQFDVVNGKITRVSELNKLCPSIIGQVHALGTTRLIAVAADLGFPGVRPRLSIPRDAIPSFASTGEVSDEDT
jgi:hypothetical protein